MNKIKLMVSDVDASPALDGTRFGGLPAFNDKGDFEWPTCPDSAKPMLYMGQIRLEDEPTLVSLFICKDCDTYDADGGHNKAFSFAATQLVHVEKPTKLPKKAIEREYAVRLEQVMAESMISAIQEWKGEGEAFGKLGGTPDWMQNPEVPKCSACKKAMKFKAQLTSGGAFESAAMNFGDGDAYVFHCACGRGSAKFGWQCY